MPLVFFVTLFSMVLISLLANPAPESIEFADFILIILPAGLAIFSLNKTTAYKLYPAQYPLLYAVTFYLSYLLLSAFMGLLQGVPLLKVLRSIGPYLNFFPLLLLGLLPRPVLRPAILAFILTVVGLLQIGYLGYLYLHTSHANSIQVVLLNRITVMDQRTTLPLLLAVPILPIILTFHASASSKKRFFLTTLSFALVVIGLLAGIITLTRAIFLSILVSWLVFIVLYLYQQAHDYPRLLLPLLRKHSIYLLLFIVLLIILSCIPQIKMLELGLLARFDHHSAAATFDYSDGRLYDEWLPALKTWASYDWLGILFGIGAGNAFIVLNGEERTYVHNLCIYSLIYGGFYGLSACLTLYYTLFKTLFCRALQTQNSSYLAFSALLAGLFFYGQLFAVHKGLAFNIMLFLIIALAFSHPVYEDNKKGNSQDVWY